MAMPSVPAVPPQSPQLPTPGRGGSKTLIAVLVIGIVLGLTVGVVASVLIRGDGGDDVSTEENELQNTTSELETNIDVFSITDSNTNTDTKTETESATQPESTSKPSGPIPTGTLAASDFSYLGAFRLPRGEKNGSTFEYGGEAMAYRFDGDPSEPSDGTPGSIFMSGHPYQGYVAEFSIPTLKDHRNGGVERLNTASYIQGFVDITEGKAATIADPEIVEESERGYRIGGLAYLPQQGDQTSSKLYWTARIYYNVGLINNPSHGMSNADFRNLQSQGLWRLGNADSESVSRSQRTAGYILTIPENFANRYLDGRLLASGLFTQQGISGTSVGPALFAYAPWKDEPSERGPRSGASLGQASLLYYPCLGFAAPEGCESSFSDYRDDDAWLDATWLESGDKSAVVFVGRRASSAYYGDARPGDCEPNKGYHGNPYSPSMLLYNPQDLADVALGEKKADELQPYAEIDMTQYIVSTCENKLTGAGYDSTNRILYVAQQRVDEDYPLVYAFSVGE